jgi:XTP/dITP diphosphohydrolase
MRLVLATDNRGKLAELYPLLAPLGYELVTQGELGIVGAPEPHVTFIENALAKARHAADKSGGAALADDAGLCVEALGGEPGVDTAFFATRFGYPKSDATNVRAVLEQLAGKTDRRGALVSTIVALRHARDPQPLVAVGRAAGIILEAPRGTGGFGFDPVLFIESEGCTFAEMTPERKNELSHRGRAARQIVQLIREHWLHERLAP